MTIISREQKLRCAAKSLGFVARKRVPPYKNASPGWMIIDGRLNTVLAGAENGIGFELSLDQDEAFISEQEAQNDGKADV